MKSKLSPEEILSYGRRCRELIKHAYAPYSAFPVAAILVTEKGEYTGVNIENRSYGLTICAERVALFKAVSQGDSAFKYIFIYGEKSDVPLSPCGACRQVISEFSSDCTFILFSNSLEWRQTSMQELLPLDMLHDLRGQA